jgi:hypothetical protein
MQLGFLDYSVLLAVEKIKNPVLVNQNIRVTEVMNMDEDNSNEIIQRAKDRHRFKSTCGRYVYHISVIDFLTRFNFSKKVESWYKTTIKNKKKELVSCVPPELYSKRFIDFMNKQVIVNENRNLEKNTGLDSKEIKDKLFDKIYKDFMAEYSKNWNMKKY